MHAGAPFQESKRVAVVPLLYVQHGCMLAVLAFVSYGSFAIAHRPNFSCYNGIHGLSNPYNATTAVVCALWAMVVVFVCVPAVPCISSRAALQAAALQELCRALQPCRCLCTTHRPSTASMQ